jgi:hypothetical protein
MLTATLKLALEADFTEQQFTARFIGQNNEKKR